MTTICISPTLGGHSCATTKVSLSQVSIRLKNATLGTESASRMFTYSEDVNMQTVVRVALGVFVGTWGFLISLLLAGKIFGSALLSLLF